MPGQVVILHGFFSDGSAMAAYEAGIRQFISSPELLEGWRFWRPTFDYLKPFPEAADQVLEVLDDAESDGEDFTNTILMGYSTGGLVARSMVAKGFKCRNLLTISAPHMGGVWPALLPTGGSWAMAPGSEDLASLGDDTKDQAARDRYEFYGVTYENEHGEKFSDDGLFSFASQTGAGLAGPPPFREHVEIKFDTALTTPQPQAIHGVMVQDPARVQTFLGRAAQLILTYRGLKITWVEHNGLVSRSESDEYVEITNFDDRTRKLAGWSLVDNDEKTTFRFPSKAKIQAGKSIRVYTNERHAEWGGFSFESTRAIWNNRESDRAVLRDPKGQGVHSREAKPALWGTF